MAREEGVIMETTLSVTLIWALLQLLVVWFCTRLAARRQLDLKHYLELQAYLLRSGLDVSAHESQQEPLPAVPARHQLPPARVARA
jgi:hypothetical protein